MSGSSIACSPAPQALIAKARSTPRPTDSSGSEPSIALDASSSALGVEVDAALAAGASRDEVVGVLLAVGPSIGLARLVGIAPRIADALGYDVIEALERPDRYCA